jgi:hypothetical protein
MAISADKVAATAAETPAPEGAPAADVEGLPDEVLQIPAIQGILLGAPPATYAPTDAEFPEIEVVNRNGKALLAAGIGAYRTIDKKNMVLFNRLYLKPEELEKADKAGDLDSVAVPFEELNASFSENFEGAPAEGGGASAPAPATQPDADVQNRLATARMQNTTPGGPTSGPAPGAGRVLNNILKQAV